MELWNLFKGKKVLVRTRSGASYVGYVIAVGPTALLIKKGERYTLVHRNAIDAIWTVHEMSYKLIEQEVTEK